MRADIEERLSTQPIAARTKNQKAAWRDIALGIFVGGLGLILAWNTIEGIKTHYAIQHLNIELKKIDQQSKQEIEKLRRIR